MRKGYENEELKSRITARLAGYSRQASSFRDGGRGRDAARLVARGSLAAILPMAAAVTSADAQCVTSAPYGQVILGPNGQTTFRVGAPGESIRIRHSAIFGDLEVTALGPFEIARALGTFTLAVAANFGPTSSIDGSGVFDSGNFMCYSSVNGLFCGGDGGFIGLRRTDDSRLGWLDLVVSVTHNAGGATLSIGARGFKTGAGPVHVGNCSDLPVELTRFDAVVGQDGVSLSWETASELNNAGFEVERSRDDQGFRKISFVEGNGTVERRENLLIQGRDGRAERALPVPPEADRL